VGSIVDVAFSQDETIMELAFPKDWRVRIDRDELRARRRGLARVRSEQGRRGVRGHESSVGSPWTSRRTVSSRADDRAQSW
jgi:hypothetical protein